MSSSVSAASTADWKKRSVYQVLTDRFAKNQASNDACTDLSNYCGGSWKGIENNLDYI
jgi:alpha-amylase